MYCITPMYFAYTSIALSPFLSFFHFVSSLFSLSLLLCIFLSHCLSLLFFLHSFLLFLFLFNLLPTSFSLFFSHLSSSYPSFFFILTQNEHHCSQHEWPCSTHSKSRMSGAMLVFPLPILYSWVQLGSSQGSGFPGGVEGPTVYCIDGQIWKLRIVYHILLKSVQEEWVLKNWWMSDECLRVWLKRWQRDMCIGQKADSYCCSEAYQEDLRLKSRSHWQLWIALPPGFSGKVSQIKHHFPCP